MKIAILYNGSLANQYLVAKIQAKYPQAFLIEEQQSYFEQVKRACKRRGVGFWKKLDMLALGAFYFLYLERVVARRLTESLAEPTIPKAHLETPHINRPGVRRAVMEAAPDVVLVLGTRILDQKWLDLGIPIVNLHPGMMPKYRGRFCWFWPVLHRDIGNLGVTSHFVTRKVDAGTIIAQQRMGPLKDYSIASLLYGVTQCTLAVVDQTIDRLPAVSAKPQPALETRLTPVHFEPGLTDYLRYLQNI